MLGNEILSLPIRIALTIFPFGRAKWEMLQELLWAYDPIHSVFWTSFIPLVFRISDCGQHTALLFIYSHSGLHGQLSIFVEVSFLQANGTYSCRELWEVSLPSQKSLVLQADIVAKREAAPRTSSWIKAYITSWKAAPQAQIVSFSGVIAEFLIVYSIILEGPFLSIMV